MRDVPAAIDGEHCMAGLDHNFLLLRLKEAPYWAYSHHYNDPQAIRLHDDFVAYIGDTLKWIPCYVPVSRAEMREFKGLNTYGPTIIKADGAHAAHEIFSLWSMLFSYSPDILKLTGSWGWIEGEGTESGRYATIIAGRDKVVQTFRRLSEYAKRVAESEDELYILHLGI